MTMLCFILLTGLFFITGCKKENENEPPIDKPTLNPIEIQWYEYQACIPLNGWINLNYNEKVIIINSKEKLDNYIAPAYLDKYYSEVDFSKYSLLLVSGKSENSAAYITKKLQKFSENKYKLDIEVFLNPVSANKNWHFAIRIEKISDESSIELKTKTSMGESDYYYGYNGVKEWYAVRKDFALVHCKSETDVIALCEKSFILWAITQPFEYDPVWAIVRINPLQVKLDDLLQCSEVVSATYGLEHAELMGIGFRRVRFPMNSISITSKAGEIPEHILDKVGLTEYVEKINTYHETSTITLTIGLSEILRICRELFESGLCVEVIPTLAGGTEPYK